MIDRFDGFIPYCNKSADGDWCHYEDIERQYNKWQPIETAPTDGTQFFTYYYGQYEIMHWSEVFGTWITTDQEDDLFTHWQPLPEPPHEN